MTKKTKSDKPHKENIEDKAVSLAPLEFEEALRGLLQTPPATNKEVAPTQKKKRKPSKLKAKK